MHRARKRFGQHFLHDPGVLRRIIDAIAPEPGERLVEIGPGRGALTLPLLARCGRLEAIEIDRDLVPLLRQKAAGAGELVVHEADDLSEVVQAMRIAGFRRVPVLTQAGALTGVIAMDDAIEIVAGFLGDICGSIRNEQRQERRIRSA